MAQITKNEYFMKTSYMKTSLNPALRPKQAQLVVPILPNIGAGFQTNTINWDHLTFKKNGERVTFIHPSVGNDEFLKNISRDNYARADIHYKIFGIGFFHKSYYTSIDINMRAHVDINIPKSVFQLLKIGFAENKETYYNLKDINAAAQAYIELGVSQSRPFLDNTLMLGARPKILLGAGYLDLNAKKFDLWAGADEWRSRSELTLQGAAPGAKARFSNKNQLNGFDFKWDGIPGYGLGLDLGAVYSLDKVLPVLKGMKVSAAINDIGFISWTKRNTVNMTSSEQEVVVNPNSPANIEGNKSIKDVFDDALDDLQEAIDLQNIGDGKKARTIALRVNMYMGVEYEIVENKLSVGTLYSAHFGKYRNTHEFTFSGNYQPYYWLGLTGSYSVIHSSFNTFGFAMHLAPRKGVTFFLASDYIIPHVSTQFLPTTSKGLNLQLGFSIPLGKPAIL